jgi:hypothetical protein
MNTNQETAERRPYDPERQREEADWTLNAIVGAIVTNRLPPNDAFAWARIAACEAAPFIDSGDTEAIGGRLAWRAGSLQPAIQ